MKKMFAMGLTLGMPLSFLIIYISLFIAALCLVIIWGYNTKLKKLKKLNNIN